MPTKGFHIRKKSDDDVLRQAQIARRLGVVTFLVRQMSAAFTLRQALLAGHRQFLSWVDCRSKGLA